MTTSRFTTSYDIFSEGVLGAPVKPSLTLNFTKSLSPDHRLTTVRSGSTGTRFGRNGYIEVVPANTQRISYNPFTGECLGLLVEDTRTNVVQNTTNLGGYASTGTSQAPDGSTAYKAVPTGSVTYPGVGNLSQQFFALTTSAGQTTDYAFSGYFSSFGPLAYKPYIVVRASTAGVPANDSYALLTFNPVTGNVVSTNLGTGWTQVNAPYVALHPCGMYYVSWTIRYTQQSSLRDKIDHYLQILNESNQQIYTADGVSGFQFACMQFEQGNGATSYIPTTNAAVTRNFDSISYPVGDWFNPAEGTLYVEYTHGENSSSTRIATIFNGDERIFLIGSNSNFSTGPYAEIASGGNIVAQLLDGAPTLRTRRAVALSYKENDFRFSKDGRAVKSDQLGTVPTGLSVLYVGSAGNTPLGGHIARLLYYPKTFTDNELKMITTT